MNKNFTFYGGASELSSLPGSSLFAFVVTKQFTNLGINGNISLNKWYISVMIYETGFGTMEPSTNQFVTTTVGRVGSGSSRIVSALCSPGQTCASNFFLCQGQNAEVTQFVDPSEGGSLFVQTTSTGISSSATPFCMSNTPNGNSTIYVKYYLTGEYQQSTPTYAPTKQLLPIINIINGVGAEGIITDAAFAYPIIGGGTLLFLVMGIVLVRMRKTNHIAVHLTYLSTLTNLTLLGSSFFSDGFLIFILLSSPQYHFIGVCALIGRLGHIIPWSLIVFQVFIQI